MINRALDWIDETAGGFIRLAYLAAGVTAVAVYFGAGHLPPAVADALNAALPWSLASAIETHTYLSARRVRAAWQDLQAATAGGVEQARAVGALKVNLAILAALLAFSCWNQLNYLLATWTPPHTALVLPGWVAYVVRAVVTPAAFMCAAFLAPMGQSLAARVQAEAHTLTAAAFKVARRQWRDRLGQMQQRREDVTGALVQLVEDPAERRMLETIRQAMYPGAPVAEIPAAAHIVDGIAVEPMPAPVAVFEAAGFEGDERPPTGPGTPRASKGRQGRRGAGRHDVLKLTPPTPEMRARDVLAEHPSASVAQLAKWAHIGLSAASKWRAVWLSEQAERHQDGQEEAV